MSKKLMIGIAVLVLVSLISLGIVFGDGTPPPTIADSLKETILSEMRTADRSVNLRIVDIPNSNWGIHEGTIKVTIPDTDRVFYYYTVGGYGAFDSKIERQRRTALRGGSPSLQPTPHPVGLPRERLIATVAPDGNLRRVFQVGDNIIIRDIDGRYPIDISNDGLTDSKDAIPSILARNVDWTSFTGNLEDLESTSGVPININLAERSSTATYPDPDSPSITIRTETAKIEKNGDITTTTTDFPSNSNKRRSVETTNFAEGGTRTIVEFKEDGVEKQSVTYEFRDQQGRPHKETLNRDQYEVLGSVLGGDMYIAQFAREAILAGVDLTEGDPTNNVIGDLDEPHFVTKLENTDIAPNSALFIDGKEKSFYDFDNADAYRTDFEGTVNSALTNGKITGPVLRENTEGTLYTYDSQGRIRGVQSREETPSGEYTTGILEINYDAKGDMSIRLDGTANVVSLTNFYADLEGLFPIPNERETVHNLINKLKRHQKESTRTELTWQNRFADLETALGNAVSVGQTLAGVYNLFPGDDLQNTRIGQWLDGFSESLTGGDDFYGATGAVCRKIGFNSPISPDQGTVLADTTGAFPRAGAHIEATRTPGFKRIENDEEKIFYIYYITFDIYLGPPNDNTGIESVNLNIELKGQKNIGLFDEDYLLEKEIKDQPPNIFGFFGAGEDGAFIDESETLYEEACITFTENPFPGLMDGKEICTNIEETAAEPETLRELGLKIEEEQEGAGQAATAARPRIADI